MVGWFRADDAGNVTAAGGRLVLQTSFVPMWFSLSPYAIGPNQIAVTDTSNGLYEVRIAFVSEEFGRQMFLSGSLLLDDPRGRTGKLAADYRFEAGGSITIRGVVAGEVVSQ